MAFQRMPMARSALGAPVLGVLRAGPGRTRDANRLNDRRFTLTGDTRLEAPPPFMPGMSMQPPPGMREIALEGRRRAQREGDIGSHSSTLVHDEQGCWLAGLQGGEIPRDSRSRACSRAWAGGPIRLPLMRPSSPLSSAWMRSHGEIHQGASRTQHSFHMTPCLHRDSSTAGNVQRLGNSKQPCLPSPADTREGHQRPLRHPLPQHPPLSAGKGTTFSTPNHEYGEYGGLTESWGTQPFQCHSTNRESKRRELTWNGVREPEDREA